MNRQSILKIRSLAFLVLLWIRSWDVGVGIAFPNQITRDPEVECGQDTIRLNVATSNGLPSKIFAKGHSGNPGCFVEDAGGATFSLSNCNMERQRMLSPRGLSYGLVVVVQLHPLFITKVDRAYSIKCFYMEADKPVSTALDVSMISVETVEESHAMPQCMYVLHGETPNGPTVKYARVGDKVWHTWDCPSDVYGMLVHSCYVKDDQGAEVQILDANGCGVDQYVLRTPVYNDKGDRAQQETHTFKFADKMAIRFNCQIKLCFKSAGGCDGITPPRCPDTAGSLPNSNTLQINIRPTTVRGQDDGSLTTAEVSSALPRTEPTPILTSEITTQPESLGVVNPGTESASFSGQNAAIGSKTPPNSLTEELTSEGLMPVTLTDRSTTERLSPMITNPPVTVTEATGITGISSVAPSGPSTVAQETSSVAQETSGAASEDSPVAPLLLLNSAGAPSAVPSEPTTEEAEITTVQIEQQDQANEEVLEDTVEGSGEAAEVNETSEGQQPQGSLEVPEPLLNSVPLDSVELERKMVALGLARDDPIRALLHDQERRKQLESSDTEDLYFPLGTRFSVEDVRGRRNVMRPEVALREQDSEIFAGDLELDVNSEMFVLEPEEQVQTSENRQQREHVPRLQAIDTGSYSGKEICMSTGGFGIIMSTFVLMVFCCSAAIFALCIRSRSLKSRSLGLNSLYCSSSASSVSGGSRQPSTAGSTQGLAVYNYRI